MATKHQKFEVNLARYSPSEREAISLEIIEYIKERTRQGKDVNGNAFKKYSTAYETSLNFKIAGKTKGFVDLTLSGDMLDSIQLLKNAPKVQIGFEKGSVENGKADGNIRGTYGNPSPIPGKARPFLGIKAAELKAILEKYPLDDRELSKARADAIVSAKDVGEAIETLDEEDA